jgi:hypothetical protein
MHLAPSGYPDWLIVLPDGRVLWWESKTPIGDLSEEQSKVHARLNRLGHRVITSSDTGDVVRAAMDMRNA